LFRFGYLTLHFSSSVIYERIVVTGSTVYAVGLTKVSSSYTLHVTAVSSSTGEELSTANVRSSIDNGPRDFFTLTTNVEENPHLVWLEHGVVKHVALIPKLPSKPTSLSGPDYDQIINLGLGEKGFFVARKSDGGSHVYKLETAKFQRKWEFTGSVSHNCSNWPILIYHSPNQKIPTPSTLVQ
jgi:hypothetical protein